MNLIKVINGKVELRKDNGVLVRTLISSGAVGQHKKRWHFSSSYLPARQGRTT
jgi:hypothetical protein